MGYLAKLAILPFDDSENVQAGPPSGPPFIAQFNPETFALTNEVNYGPEEPPHGADGDEAKFRSIDPRKFNFELLLDGTGASGEKREVLAQIELFKVTVGFHGKIHRPRFLVLNWGTFIFTCVLESFTITYKLFRPDGTPLRASLSASFKEHKPTALRQLLENVSSPDVAHAHAVKAGEHLPLITHRVYKDSRYYMEVARTNGLHTVRHVKPGTTLNLHPLR